MTFYRRVEIVDGETKEPVNFVGFYPILWMEGDRAVIQPTTAFVETDIVDDLLDAYKAIVREYDAETATRDWPTANDFVGFCIEQAQAAIAKAEGSKMAHTPGPWTTLTYDPILRCKLIDAYFVVIDKLGGRVARVEPRSTDEEEIANAKLIAAAPDLLDACRAIAREYDAETATRDWPTANDFASFCIEQAQAAIAKAEGQECK